MENTLTHHAEPARPAHLSRALRPGKSIKELAQELDRIQESKRDFLVPVESLRADTYLDDSERTSQVALNFKNGTDHAFTLNNWSGVQVGTFTDIPRDYFKRLAGENPSLLADNINHGLGMAREREEAPRLIRTIDGHVRGFLSHRYRILDAHDLMQSVLPHLIEHNFQVIGAELTERRLYLKAATERIQGEVKKGDVVSYGVMISTSDVGAGSLRVEPFFLSLWCLNGAVMESKFQRAHLGRANFESEVREVLSDETKRLNDEAFFATVRDYLGHTMKPQVFHAALSKMKEAAEKPIKNLELNQVVELASQTLGVTNKTVQKNVLEALIDGASFRGLNAWGLSNAFTAAAKSPDLDYDTAVDLERAGGAVLTLNANQWRRISEVVQ